MLRGWRKGVAEVGAVGLAGGAECGGVVVAADRVEVGGGAAHCWWREGGARGVVALLPRRLSGNREPWSLSKEIGAAESWRGAELAMKLDIKGRLMHSDDEGGEVGLVAHMW
jgi:hypothetical protein